VSTTNFEITTVIVRHHDTGQLALAPSHAELPDGKIADASLPLFRRLFRSMWRMMLPLVYQQQTGDLMVELDGEGPRGPRVFLSRIDAANGHHWAAMSPEVQYLNAYEMRLHAAALLEGADMMDAKNATENMLRETLEGKR
jgi:hypothetical protein